MALLVPLQRAQAYDFTDGTFYYNVLSEKDRTFEVTYKGRTNSYTGNSYITGGNYSIPTTVIYNNKEYTVTAIGDSAFYGSENWQTKAWRITVPSTVTKIGKYAFSNLRNLTSVSLPDNIKSLPTGLFRSSYHLQTVHLPKDIAEIPDSAFIDCSALDTVSLPAGIKRIGKRAFYECRHYAPTLPEGLQVIDDAAFINSGLSYASSITLPESLDSIGSFALWDWDYTEGSITIPSNVRYIGDYAFNKNTIIAKPTTPPASNGTIIKNMCVYVPHGSGAAYRLSNAWKDNSVFEEGEDTTVLDIPQGSRLSTVVTDEGITSATLGRLKIKGELIAEDFRYLKRNFSALNYVDLSEAKATAIPGKSFPRYIEEVRLPQSETELRDSALYGCVGLHRIDMGGVTEIGKYCFGYDTKLKVITGMNHVKRVAAYGFTMVIKNIESSDTYIYLDDVDSVCVDDMKNWLGITFENAYSNPLSSAYRPRLFVNGKLAENITVPDGTTQIKPYAFSNAKFLKSISLPNSVTDIAAGAFSGCKNLTSVILPEGLTKINDETFKNSGLTSITLPESVTTIGNSAFYGTPLTSINMDHLTSIGASSFEGTQLEAVELPLGITLIPDYAFRDCKKLKSVIIPNTVTWIGKWAFASTGLSHISIPNSVSYVGHAAFNKITDITLQDGGPGLKAEDNEADDGYWPGAFGDAQTFYAGQNIYAGGPSSADDPFYSFGWVKTMQKLTYGPKVTEIETLGTKERIDTVVILSKTPNDNMLNGIVRAKKTILIPFGTKDAYVSMVKSYSTCALFEEVDTVKIHQQQRIDTYCSPYDLDFTNVKGLKAYVATNYDEQTATLTLKPIQKSRGGEGLILVGDAGSYAIPCTNISDSVNNYLEGGIVEKYLSQTDAANTYYIYNGSETAEGASFSKLTNPILLPAAKSYLSLPNNMVLAEEVNVIFDNNPAIPSSITDIPNSPAETIKSIYTLDGMKVRQDGYHLPKGIYIINGKKIVK